MASEQEEAQTKYLSQSRRDQGTLGAGQMVSDPEGQTRRVLGNAGRVHCSCPSRSFNVEPQAKGFWTGRDGV